jgi:poly(beta-D-mannuronate) lyase
MGGPSSTMRATLLAGVGAVALWLVPLRAAAECPSLPPLAEVVAQPIYSDPSGSQLDPKGLHRNQQLIQPLRDFTGALTERADGEADEAALRCAGNLLREWGAAGAMLRQPNGFPAIRERQRFALGITMAALKLRARGASLDGTVAAWLHALDTAVAADFARRHLTDNLAVWSAANAASIALVDGDRASLAYENAVWSEGLHQIGPDGYVPSELRRKSRALLYHQYYTSALLYLRALRSALGEPPTAREDADLRRLIDRVETALCDPKSMESASGGYPQEPPRPEQFAVGLVFGADLIDARWTRCGSKPLDLREDTLGGQLGGTFALLNRPRTAPSPGRPDDTLH